MDCKQAEQMMMADLDGELDAPGVVHLRAHLASCDACRAAHAGLARLGAMVRDEAGGHPAPAHLRQRIMAALPAAAPARRPVRNWPWAWINFGAAAAFGLLLATTELLPLLKASPVDQLEQEVVNSHFRSLMADHLTDVASSDQHTVKPWFAGKLDFSPPVVDLAAQGFPRVGGRRDSRGGRTVAGLAYRRHQHVINLFIWPAGDAGSAALRISSRQGYQIASWRENGFEYKAVSDMNGQDLASFERLLGGH
jgi:anti-sigma factor RsiW